MKTKPHALTRIGTTCPGALRAAAIVELVPSSPTKAKTADPSPFMVPGALVAIALTVLGVSFLPGLVSATVQQQQEQIQQQQAEINRIQRCVAGGQ